MSRRLITVIGGLPAVLGCVLGFLLVHAASLAILFLGGLLPIALCWLLCVWATQGMVSRKDLPEARLRALRRSLPSPTHKQACVLCDEVLPDDSWLVGPRNSALVGYFEWEHDADEMERRMHERVFPDGWERGAMLRSGAELKVSALVPEAKPGMFTFADYLARAVERTTP